jgi:hypothetical protein
MSRPTSDVQPAFSLARTSPRQVTSQLSPRITLEDSNKQPNIQHRQQADVLMNKYNDLNYLG